MNQSPDVELQAALSAAKASARKSARNARDAARSQSPGAARLAAAEALAVAAPLKSLGRVAGYLPIGSELDPRPLILALHGLGVPLCMPVVVAPDAPLVFRPWSPGTATARSAFGIDEPAAGEAVRPDFLLVPLLAFDGRGHRLGYGGGYYDRTLAALRAGGDVRAVGYAYAAQQVERVPSGGTDAGLDAIITERGVIRPS
jgi:5-formyltetrahydrofolate cyclo-ligase